MKKPKPYDWLNIAVWFIAVPLCTVGFVILLWVLFFCPWP